MELYGLIHETDSYEEIVFIDNKMNSLPKCILESDFVDMPHSQFEIIVGMGEPYMRDKMYKKYKKMNYQFATFVHRTAVVQKGTIIKEGSIVFPLCYIAQESVVDTNVLVHAGVRIENNCYVGANSFVSSGAFVGARTMMGESVFVGPNASIRDCLQIGNESIIGIGSNVLHNVDSGVVVAGNPARWIKNNTEKMFLSH